MYSLLLYGQIFVWCLVSKQSKQSKQSKKSKKSPLNRVRDGSKVPCTADSPTRASGSFFFC